MTSNAALILALICGLIAVGFAWILRGPGGGPHGSAAAQGTLDPPLTRDSPRVNGGETPDTATD